MAQTLQTDAAGSRPLRIVVKLGTNVIMRSDGRVALGLLCGLVESIAALREQGHQVLVVSSGSIGLGMERLGLATRPTDLASIQACAATGQSRLMSIYEDSFDRLGCRTAQVLLTEDDFRSSVRHSNLARTLHALLALGVIPVINENDTVSVAELDTPSPAPTREKLFGDNDKLSALVATHIAADLLVLLSDVDGLFDRHPADPAARLLSVVPSITPEILAHAHGGNGRGRGGMLSKLEAARIAQAAGLSVVIANGRTPRVLEHLLQQHTSHRTGGSTMLQSPALGTRFPGLSAAGLPGIPGVPSPAMPIPEPSNPGAPVPDLPDPGGLPAPGAPAIPEPPAPDTPSPDVPEPGPAFLPA